MGQLVLVKASKGQVLDLTKTVPGTTMFKVGLGWNVNTDSSIKDDIDIDVVAIKTDLSSKGAVDAGVFFYNNVDGAGGTSETVYAGLTIKEDIFKKAESIAGSSVVAISKDNRTGEGDGDDETLYINTSLLSDNDKITIAVNIYEASTRRQNFGMVKGAYVTLYDNTGAAAITYDLGEDFSIETGVIVAEIYRKDGVPKFKALGNGFSGDLNDLMTQFQ